MIDIREPKKAKRLSKLKMSKHDFIKSNFFVEGDTMLTVATKSMKNDSAKLLKVRLLSEGPVLYDETPIDMKAWPMKYDYHSEQALALFKKDKYIIIVTALREIGVFELLEKNKDQ
jgi:hypothetical protein